MEHVIMAREGSVLSCGRMYRGSCVALWPRGGRGEMVDRANELELAAWRRGRGRSWMLLDDFGTFILRTFSAVHYHPRPRPRVVEARLVAELIFIWPILCPQWQCLFSDTRGRPSPVTWRRPCDVAYKPSRLFAILPHAICRARLASWTSRPRTSYGL